jgi:hypothetical protein
MRDIRQLRTISDIESFGNFGADLDRPDGPFVS